MDVLALIEQARDAGLELSAFDGQLVMKGPRRLSSLVKLIAQNKESVLGALMPPSPAPQEFDSQLSTSVGVTETPLTPTNDAGFADSVNTLRKARQNRQPIVSPQPPPEIVADPVILCSRCNKVPVLRELRTMTGGLCYMCWETGART